MSDSPWIINTTEEQFQVDVLDRSQTAPVVVDFWAPWCAPCRSLAPLLEQLAIEFDGQFILVKANTDETPNMAQAFRVEGIPAVFGLRNGQIVNQFTGLLTEPELREWLKSILPSPIEQLLASAKLIAETDPVAAEGHLRTALELDPQNVEATVALGQALLAQGKLAECHALVDDLDAKGLLTGSGEALHAQLALRTQASAAGSVATCRAALAAEPNNFERQLQLAQALIGEKQHEEALKLCLDLVDRDRAGQGEKAREMMVNLFQLLGEESDLTRTYRRRLSSVLF